VADDAMPVGSPGSKKLTEVKGGTETPARKLLTCSVAANRWGERGGRRLVGARLYCCTGCSKAENVHVSTVTVKRVQIPISDLNWG